MKELHCLFINLADYCRHIPRIQQTCSEGSSIPKVALEAISYEDHDKDIIKRRFDKINMRYFRCYHDHEQCSINNASVATILLDLRGSWEHGKYLPYINSVFVMLDHIVKLDREINEYKAHKVKCERDGWLFDDGDDADDNPRELLRSITNEVVEMMESGGEVKMYAHDLMKPLLEPLSCVRR